MLVVGDHRLIISGFFVKKEHSPCLTSALSKAESDLDDDREDQDQDHEAEQSENDVNGSLNSRYLVDRRNGDFGAVGTGLETLVVLPDVVAIGLRTHALLQVAETDIRHADDYTDNEQCQEQHCQLFQLLAHSHAGSHAVIGTTTHL